MKIDISKYIFLYIINYMYNNLYRFFIKNYNYV